MKQRHVLLVDVVSHTQPFFFSKLITAEWLIILVWICQFHLKKAKKEHSREDVLLACSVERTFLTSVSLPVRCG